MKNSLAIDEILELMPNHPGVSKEQRIELYKIAVANSDIGEALITTNFFIENVSDMQNPLYLSLQDTIIISYTRPFTGNRPFGAISEAYFKSVFNPQVKSLHNKLMNTRHKLVAHSDFVERKVEVVPKGNKPTLSSLENNELAIQVTTKKFPIEMFPKIQNLCKLTGGILDRLMQKKINEYYGDMDNLPTKPFSLI